MLQAVYKRPISVKMSKIFIRGWCITERLAVQSFVTLFHCKWRR